MEDPPRCLIWGTAGKRIDQPDKIIDTITDHGPLKAISDRIKSFEAGKLIGGKPWMMETDIPGKYLNYLRNGGAMDILTRKYGNDYSAMLSIMSPLFKVDSKLRGENGFQDLLDAVLKN